MHRQSLIFSSSRCKQDKTTSCICMNTLQRWVHSEVGICALECICARTWEDVLHRKGGREGGKQSPSAKFVNIKVQSHDQKLCMELRRPGRRRRGQVWQSLITSLTFRILCHPQQTQSKRAGLADIYGVEWSRMHESSSAKFGFLPPPTSPGARTYSMLHGL
jgi:hypothetical protein